MGWDDLTGQTDAIATMRAASTDDGMTHSWLITGPPGSGRSILAYAFAAALIARPGDEEQTELQVTNRTHPDLGVLSTDRVLISIDEVRALVATSQFSPSVGRHRVMVIEDADRMTERTSNVLLKALEEPPARTVWILCAPSEADLIPTIRSRVRTVRLRVPAVDEVAELISRRDGVSLPEALRSAREAQSHIGMAHRLATNEQARERRRRTLELALGIRSVAGAVIAASELLEVAAADAKAITEERDATERESVLRSLGLEPGGTVPPGAALAVEGARRRPEASRNTQPARRDRPHSRRSALALPRHPAAAIGGRAGAREPGDLLRPGCCGRGVGARANPRDPRRDRARPPPDRRQCGPGARPRVDAGVCRSRERTIIVTRSRHPCRSRRDRRHRRVLAVAVLLSGCVSWFLPPRPSETSTPTGEQVAADLQPFYSQILRWSSCGDGMQCTTAQAPMDWADPTAASIDLALVRQPTRGTAKGSLLINPGGPGGSGYDFVLDSIDYATSERLQQNFDIVGFDPRGVGRSSAVSCYDDPAVLDEYNYGIVPGEYGSDEWIANLAAGEQGVRRGLPRAHRASLAVRRHGQRRARPRPAARRARRREAELPRLLVRHLPRCDLRRPLPRQDGAARARRRRRSVDHRLRRDRYAGDGLRKRHARVPR